MCSLPHQLTLLNMFERIFGQQRWKVMQAELRDKELPNLLDNYNLPHLLLCAHPKL